MCRKIDKQTVFVSFIVNTRLNVTWNTLPRNIINPCCACMVRARRFESAAHPSALCERWRNCLLCHSLNTSWVHIKPHQNVSKMWSSHFIWSECVIAPNLSWLSKCNNSEDAGSAERSDSQTKSLIFNWINVLLARTVMSMKSKDYQWSLGSLYHVKLWPCGHCYLPDTTHGPWARTEQKLRLTGRTVA